MINPLSAMEAHTVLAKISGTDYGLIYAFLKFDYSDSLFLIYAVIKNNNFLKLQFTSLNIV